jgi:hypothetical protein
MLFYTDRLVIYAGKNIELLKYKVSPICDFISDNILICIC